VSPLPHICNLLWAQQAVGIAHDNMIQSCKACLKMTHMKLNNDHDTINPHRHDLQANSILITEIMRKPCFSSLQR
jgi:5-keto 4-deoxyuronate isomerase